MGRRGVQSQVGHGVTREIFCVIFKEIFQCNYEELQGLTKKFTWHGFCKMQPMPKVEGGAGELAGHKA